MECSVDEDCTSSEYSHCQLEGESGYCTKSDCTAGSDDCPGSYACNDRTDPSFCERPPTGLGTACSSNEDCQDFEASYCELFSEQAVIPEAAEGAMLLGLFFGTASVLLLISAALAVPLRFLAGRLRGLSIAGNLTALPLLLLVLLQLTDLSLALAAITAAVTLHRSKQSG